MGRMEMKRRYREEMMEDEIMYLRAQVYKDSGEIVVSYPSSWAMVTYILISCLHLFLSSVRLCHEP